MLYLNRKVNETIVVIDNATGKQFQVVVLDAYPKYNEERRVYEATVKIGLEDVDKNYTFLRKEVLQREAKNPNPNPFYKDQLPSWWGTKKETTSPLDKDRPFPSYQKGNKENVQNETSNSGEIA